MKFLKPLIKVPLVLCENILFSLFPKLRPCIERSLYNPLDFQEKHIEYSQKKFQEFKTLTSPHRKLDGQTILELGPGGSVGFGLLALQAGAKKYIAIDDGQHAFIKESHLKSYRTLLGDDSTLFNRYFIQTADGSVTYNPIFIEFVTIDQHARYPLPDSSVDIMYSCAVLEHVHNLDAAFSEMTRVLKPGGIMYHEVDLRDHIFSQESLWFLTISDFWFRLLFKNTGGYVNRKRLSHYKNLITENQLSIIKLQPTIQHSEKGDPKRKLTHYSEEDQRVVSFISILKKHAN
jgi:SAM-dependent methyltransferase